MLLDCLFQSRRKKNFNKAINTLSITMNSAENAEKLMKSFHRFFVTDGNTMIAKKYIKIFKSHNHDNEVLVEIRDGLLHDLGLSVYMTFCADSNKYVFQIINEDKDIDDEMDNRPYLMINGVDSITTCITPIM